MPIYSIKLEMGEINRRWFTTQKEAAEWLGIKNSSKAALKARARKLNWVITFDN